MLSANLKELFEAINVHFNKKLNYFKIFSELDTRVEGWFKAEMFLIFNKLKTDKIIKNYIREINIKKSDGKRNLIDFEISLISGKKILLELKAMVTSQNAKTPRDLHFYFRHDKVGLFSDFSKLDLMNKYKNNDKYVIGFIYPKPSIEDWKKAINKMTEENIGWSCISKLSDYKPSHFISIWSRKYSNLNQTAEN